jgi:hypothetical protein
MNEPINYVAPVFPTPAGTQHNDGMTLRDYFAAAALQGILAYDGGGKSCLQDAELAYQAADAMIRERESK